MIRFEKILSTLVIIFIISQSLLAQDPPLMLSHYKADIISGGTSNASNRIRSENEIYLETFFSPDTIPTSGIPVLENALGDIVKDSIVNLIDLLRLRDIIVGRAPSPSPYENAEGDLTRDGKIDAQDLNVFRDILLRKASIPYLVGSTGGQVLGDGITLTVPPGAVDSTIVISITRTSESEFARDMGVDTEGALQDSAYFMASFDIISSTLDFKLPVNATIKLDSMPPCAYQGLNGLFAAVPDRDGDGRTDLFLINQLLVGNDSLTLTTEEISIPTIQSISLSQAEPGQSITVVGAGFGENIQSIIVDFISALYPDSSQFVDPSYMDDSTIVVYVPGLSSGQYKIVIKNIQTGVISNPHSFEILPQHQVVGDIRSIIVNFYVSVAVGVDLINVDSLYKELEDTTVQNYLVELHRSNRAFVDTLILFFTGLPDSLLNNYATLASFIETLTDYSKLEKRQSYNSVAEAQSCWPCDPRVKDGLDVLSKHIQSLRKQLNEYVRLCLNAKVEHECYFCDLARDYAIEILKLTDQYADDYTQDYNCKCIFCDKEEKPEGCDKCPKTTFIGYGPKGLNVTGGYGSGGFGTKGCCINIVRYKRNQCTRTVGFSKNPIPPELWQLIQCKEVSFNARSMSSTLVDTLLDIQPHPGCIVKVTNAPVPYNIVGILNDNGNAFIPQVPMNTKVTFSMYDPVTGLYDPDVGTYTTGTEPGGFDRPLLLFRPKTSIRNFIIKIGDLMHDSITQDMQRIDYSLMISAADTSKLLNIGFSATTRLSFHIEDPDGIILFDNMDLSCYLNSHLKFNKIGQYYLRVAIGVSAQSGQFDLGISESPSKPIPTSCLCNDVVVDTLFEELSPYEVSCAATIADSDTIVTEAGVTLEFDEGGVIIANGPLIGTGSPMKPITLKELQVDKRKTLSVRDKIKHGTQRRKEVEP